LSFCFFGVTLESMKRFLIIFTILFVSFSFITAQDNDVKSDVGKIKDRDVETVDLGEAGKDKLKLGLSLGYPLSGITAGWQLGKSLELDGVVGSGWNYNYIGLGLSTMFSLVDLKISEEIFPITIGPFGYAGVGTEFLGFSAGAMVRFEYTFDFRLNLYLESGFSVNFMDMAENQDIPIGFPTSLGIRYIF
jgi:hypothetical protein